MQLPKDKRCIAQPKNKKQKVDTQGVNNNINDIVEENTCCPNYGQSSSSTHCCSEDDSNGGGTTSDSKTSSAALNSTGKPRASRGAATDPQSLYARVRVLISSSTVTFDFLNILYLF